MKIQYIGKKPVRLNGIRGEIQPGTTQTLPEKICCNLILDKENWKPGEEVDLNPNPNTNTNTNTNTLSIEETPVEKKKRKKEVKEND